MMLIYLITNKKNKKQYVGLTTVGLNKRVACYRSFVKNPPKKLTKILKAMCKYGFESFEFEVLQTGFNSYEELQLAEISWIAALDTYKNGYNASLGGDLSSEETRRKQSMAQKGRIHSPEARAKIAETLRGRKRTKETIEKISQKLKGRVPWNKGIKGIMKPNSGSFKKKAA